MERSRNCCPIIRERNITQILNLFTGFNSYFFCQIGIILHKSND